VEESYEFTPPKKTGVIFHLVIIIAFIIIVIYCLYRIAYTEVGPTFLFYLIPILVAIPTVPLFAYRLNSLHNAIYIMERDNIHLQWGLRVEVIPTASILWIQSATSFSEPIHLPWIRWPGSVLGNRLLGGRTPIEFMASASQDLVLIATYERVFAISPTESGKFLSTYQQLTELGSLVKTEPQSIFPTTIFTGVWQTRASRYLLIISILLGIIMIFFTGLIAPSRFAVSLGFLPSGEPRDVVPSIRLMLLPILYTIFWFTNFFAGIILTRYKDHQPLAYLLWVNNIVVALLFLIAVYSILTIG
jgi:hypothetical protein